METRDMAEVVETFRTKFMEGAAGIADRVAGACAGLVARPGGMALHDMELEPEQLVGGVLDSLSAAAVTEDLTYDVSKPAMALEMVRHLKKLGGGVDCVCGDGLYGDSPDLVAGLEQDGQLYVLDVHSNMTVWLDQPLDAAGKADGKARRIAARKLAASVPAAGWRGITIRCGTAGVIRAGTLARGVWTLRGDGEERRQAVGVGEAQERSRIARPARQPGADRRVRQPARQLRQGVAPHLLRRELTRQARLQLHLQLLAPRRLLLRQRTVRGALFEAPRRPHEHQTQNKRQNRQGRTSHGGSQRLRTG